MAYKALYRKYRPQTFSDVVGQDHIVDTLKGELSAGKISHAYLFTGTRGTGKTSCAKILAKAVNCENPQNGDPCLNCPSCLAIGADEVTDIVEIDAASNNSVEDIRNLREQIAFTPATVRYRVYIIDEVHMLSVSAFNALLKTLEEPPEHALFILATTEVHKLPATILSRCQRFDFRRIEPAKIAERIRYIADKEGFTVTPEAESLIAAAADGGMRDALSILDLCLSASHHITEQVVTEVCGMSGNEYLNRLSDCIFAQDADGALRLIDELHKNSVDMLRLCGELASHFRDIMIVSTVSGDRKPVVCSAAQMEILKQKAAAADIKDIMRALSMLSACTAEMQTTGRRGALEMTVIKLCNPALCADYDALESRVRALEHRTVAYTAPAEKTAPTPPEDPPAPCVEQPDRPSEPVPPVPNRPSATPAAENAVDTPVAAWNEILKILSKSCPLIYGVLNGSGAYISGAYLLIDAPNPQFRDLINSKDPIYRDSIRKAATEVLGTTYKLGPYRAKSTKAADDPLHALRDKLEEMKIPKRS